MGDGVTGRLKRAAAANALLALRWEADAVARNHFGEVVWLRRFPPRPNWPAGGITDCCGVLAPCERHAAMTPPEWAVPLARRLADRPEAGGV